MTTAISSVNASLALLLSQRRRLVLLSRRGGACPSLARLEHRRRASHVKVEVTWRRRLASSPIDKPVHHPSDRALVRHLSPCFHFSAHPSLHHRPITMRITYSIHLILLALFEPSALGR